MHLLQKIYILSYHSVGEGSGVARLLTLLQWKMFLTEEILPNYSQGRGPRVCETSLPMGVISNEDFTLSTVSEKVCAIMSLVFAFAANEFSPLKCLVTCFAALEHFSNEAILLIRVREEVLDF